MIRDEAEVAELVQKAARIKTKLPSLSIPEAMRCVKFTIEESDNPKYQMRVRRVLAPPTECVNVSKSPTPSSVSTLTTTPVSMPP